MKKNSNCDAFIWLAGLVYLASLVAGIVLSLVLKNGLWFLLFLAGLAIAVIILRVGFEITK